MYSKLERPIWRKRSLYSALLSIRLQAGFPMLVSTPPRRKAHPEAAVTYGASSGKGHVWTAPAVQEEFDFSAKRSGAAMYAACFRVEEYLHRDAATVAAGPDVIR